MSVQMTFSDLNPSPEWRVPEQRWTPDVLGAFNLIRECERVLPLVCDPSVGAEDRAMLLRAAEKLHATLEMVLAGKN